MKVNDAILKYYRAFRNFRDEGDLPDAEEVAFRNLEEAYFRIENDLHGDVSDLPIHESIRLAHLALGWPADTVPVLSEERPVYRLGKYQPLNNTILVYFNRLQKYRERMSVEAPLFRRAHESLYKTLSEAYKRIEQNRNARVDDLLLLEAIHKAHKLLELDPVDIPHIDVSRRYEGETIYDGIDERNRVREANARAIRRPRPLVMPG